METYLTRSDILKMASERMIGGGAELQARDIRQVDPAFDAKAALWVRCSAIVVSLEGLRAILFRDRLLVFDPNKDNSEQMMRIVRQSVTVAEEEEGGGRQAFEFKALEGILIYLGMRLERELEVLRPSIEDSLRELPNELTSKKLEELRIKKQQLNHFHSRATTVKTILEGLLDEDEDMRDMYLSDKMNGEISDHNQVETLLEAYLQVIDEYVSQSQLLKGAVDETEDLVSIHLDTLRNRLLSIQLATNVVTMMFGLGGLIFGMFGMNIPISIYEGGGAGFVIVVTVTLGVGVTLTVLVLWMLRKRGVYTI